MVVLLQQSTEPTVADRPRVGDGRLRGLLQEDHHVDVPSGMDATAGVVERVWLVSRRLRHQGARSYVPIPGTEELLEVDAAPAYLPSEPPDEGALVWRSTADVLVELRVDPPRG